MPSPVITDFRAGGETLGTELDVWAVGAAQPQVGNVRQAVHAVLLAQIRHLGAGLLLSVSRARALSLCV